MAHERSGCQRADDDRLPVPDRTGVLTAHSDRTAQHVPKIMTDYNPDGSQRLIVAILKKAVRDYRDRGDGAAKEWLLSDQGKALADALDLDHCLIVARLIPPSE